MAKNQKSGAPVTKRGTARARRSGSAISMVTFYLSRQASSPNAGRKLMTRVKGERTAAERTR